MSHCMHLVQAKLECVQFLAQQLIIKYSFINNTLWSYAFFNELFAHSLESSAVCTVIKSLPNYAGRVFFGFFFFCF
jgi:hypothetical protein